MKRQIQYVAFDGKSFPDRRQAANYEVSIIRVRRITEFLCKEFATKAHDKVSLEEVAKKIGDHAIDFAELVSARATRRFLEKPGNAVPGIGLVGRRPRAQKAASSAA